MAYEFLPDEGVREAIARCAREQLDIGLHALTGAFADDAVKAVHTTRKAVKKERSLLRLAQGTMPRRQRRRENVALRDAGRGLSDARDLDVMIETLDQLSRRFAGQLPESTYDRVREPLERERDAERSRLAASALGSQAEQATQALQASNARIGDWTLRRGGWAALEPGLERSYRRGRQAMREASRDRSAEPMHVWRKRVKDLWYQQRLLAPVCGPAVKGQTRDLHRLADLLGDDHDLGVLRRRLADIHAAADIDGLVGLIEHRRGELQVEAFRVGRRVYAEKPSAFLRRIHRSWEAGRALSAGARNEHPAEVAQATRATSPPVEA